MPFLKGIVDVAGHLKNMDKSKHFKRKSFPVKTFIALGVQGGKDRTQAPHKKSGRVRVYGNFKG